MKAAFPTRVSPVKAICKIVITSEPLLLLALLIAFWQPAPPRDSWLWMLGGLPIIYAARWIVDGRPIIRFSPLDIVYLFFITITIINIAVSHMDAAPYRRAPDLFYSWLVLMGRPLLGVALALYAVQYARTNKRLDGLLWAALGLGVLVAFFSLFSTDWNSKSDQLRPIINLLPTYTGYPVNGKFNANEIAGALTWVVPLLAGFAFYQPTVNNKRWQIFRIICGLTFVLTLTALFLGQSRFALAGVLVALALMILLLLHRWRWRAVAWGGLVLIALLEIAIMRNVFSPTKLTALIERDEMSVNARFEMWQQALAILKDHPLTGVGLNMFRDNRVRELYPVPSYTNPVLPHTHNELLQMGTDMGIPGLFIYISWQLAALWMLIRIYRRNDPGLKVLAVALAGGLLAHIGFAVGDAIPIWDRFSFVYYGLLALICAADYWGKSVFQGTFGDK